MVIENTPITDRLINAPRELVWKAWTDPKHLAKWWGPEGFSNPVCEVDVKEGGRIYIVMQGPDGQQYPMDGSFTEIVQPEKLVFISAALDAEGKRLFEVTNTVLFTEQGNKTRLQLTASVSNIRPEAMQMVKDMKEGWNSSIDCLEKFLSENPQ